MKSARKDTFNFRYSQTEDVLALSKIVRFDLSQIFESVRQYRMSSPDGSG